MNMNERQPIDDRFRRALHDLEVTPPPAVWEGIVRERSRRRSGYQGWSLGLLLVAGGISLVLGSLTPERTTGAVAQASTAVVLGSGGAEPGASAEAMVTAAPGPDRTRADRPNGVGAPAEASVPAAAMEPGTPGAKGSMPGPNEPLGNSSSGRGRTMAGPARVSPTAALIELGSGATGATQGLDGRGRPNKLVVRNTAFLTAPALRDSLRSDPVRHAYVLPKADWWLALEVGRYRVERTWYGNESDLVNALNATELPHDTWSVGLLGGRSWRSGFGLSIGAAYEASEYAYAHLDSRTEVDSLLVVPYMVTLDTMIFVSNVDTTVHGTTEREQVAGANSLTVVHVPLEAYWHGQQRRWTYGLRLGLAGEFITTRSGYTLDTGAEGDLYSEAADQQAYDTRYSTTLTGLIGLDVGFAMTEHISLWATPTYMHGLATWSSDEGPWMLPERLGLRVRLGYTFTRIP